MATIVIKNSSTATAVPTAADLVQGELAVNVTDKKLYTEDASGTVVKLVGSLGNQEASAVAITGGTITGIIDLAVADGGTGSSTAAGARTNLGLGTISTQNSNSVTITGGSVTGITDLAVADGGTGASTAADARTNLGLGTIATQAASNVAITGGSVTGITDLAVADGGTGASTAAGARTNLLPSFSGNAGKVLAVNTGATDVEFISPGVGTVTSVNMTVPTGLAVSGNPVTSSGTLAVTYSAGYSIPTTTKQSNWDDAYTFVGNFPSQTGNAGEYLTTDGTNLSWAVVDALPSQTGNSGKYLTTDGSTASWATVNVTPALDDLTDVTITSAANGEVLQYNGTAWVNSTISSGNTTTSGLWENSNTISSNYTIGTNYNAMSAGPITVNSGVTVTVPSGSRWVVI